jgi:FMN phosphatase YigB (HAD superfamily)
MIAAIDLGGVLVDVDVDRCWDTLGLRAQQRTAASALLGAHHHRMQTTERGADEFIAALAVLCGTTVDDAARAWKRVVCWREGALHHLVTLQGRIDVELWTNIDRLHLEELGLVQLTTHTNIRLVASCGVGARKPDDVFFAHALAGRDVGLCHFFDDDGRNIAAALALGIHARQVSDHADVAFG